ncbi:hypothetical protein [Halomonas sp. BC04]|uniref:hypothetical protein n=1 Tax=Halomonas sp. BC04 TaxID=1403540 RepID=UPI0012DE70E6|nr:hypothetical protein [Halomonas sp. BC04]
MTFSQVTPPSRPKHHSDGDERRGKAHAIPAYFGYQTYGLHLVSQLELPELLPSTIRPDRDVDILTQTLPT